MLIPNGASCPPTIPDCRPSIGPGPAILADQNANALIRKPNSTDPYTTDMGDNGSEIEIGIMGLAVIIIMFLVVVSLWAGLAQYPRGKIKAWVRRWKTDKAQKARRRATLANAKAEEDLVEGIPTNAGAVDLTPADIESAVSRINLSATKSFVRTPSPLGKVGSGASTVAVEEKDPQQIGTSDISPAPTLSSSEDEAAAEPRRSSIRNSFPGLPFITPGSPFGSSRFSWGWNSK